MKRVWKPLDVNGMRLYRVKQGFVNHPEWDREFIVAGNSPTHAAELIKQVYKDAEFMAEPYYQGYALNVYQPAEWRE